jgi:hypothetical protein
LVHVRAVTGPLAFGGLPGSNDPDEALLGLRVDDDEETSTDRADREEAVFDVRMLRVEHFEVVRARLEEPSGLPERDAVLLPIAKILRIVPLGVGTGAW